MNLKSSKSGLRNKNVNPNDCVHCCVIVLVEHNSQIIQIILKHLYLNDYADFDSKISFVMFLHNYHLACEISTVRTLALNHRVKRMGCQSETCSLCRYSTLIVMVFHSYCLLRALISDIQ